MDLIVGGVEIRPVVAPILMLTTSHALDEYGLDHASGFLSRPPLIGVNVLVFDASTGDGEASEQADKYSCATRESSLTHEADTVFQTQNDISGCKAASS